MAIFGLAKFCLFFSFAVAGAGGAFAHFLLQDSPVVKQEELGGVSEELVSEKQEDEIKELLVNSHEGSVNLSDFKPEELVIPRVEEKKCTVYSVYKSADRSVKLESEDFLNNIKSLRGSEEGVFAKWKGLHS